MMAAKGKTLQVGKRKRDDGVESVTAATINAELRKKTRKYTRGPKPVIKGMTDKKLRGRLKERERLYGEAAVTAAKAEQWLLPSEAGLLEEEGAEHTANFRQEAIVSELGSASAQSAFDLKLPELGPYMVDYTLSGQHLLLAGEKGHLALMDWRRNRLVTELQVREKIRDVCFLHSEQFFAAAQRKYVYIYDKRGLEIHCLKEHHDVLSLCFLPHHFLLATVGKSGFLQYTDTSSGQIVSHHKTKLGRCSTLSPNPATGVLSLAHSNGTVTLWTPNLPTPVASLLCHRGPVTAIAVDWGGRHMVTTGIDGQLKVWDVRMYKALHAYFTPGAATSIDVSQKGLLAVSYGSGVQVWKGALTHKQRSPYMTHRVAGAPSIRQLKFCPYEDVLGLGHAQGYSSMLVPGAGEPNFDSFVANPFETRKQRREKEVAALLNKLQPDMIVENPDAIGTVLRGIGEVQSSLAEKEAKANAAARGEAAPVKKAKGKGKPSRRHRNKQSNIVEAKRGKIRAEVHQKDGERGDGADGEGGEEGGAVIKSGLDRFRRKGEVV